MKCLALLLAPVALLAGQARYARLGEFEGKVEVQLQAADPWMGAERNLPLTESAWLRTGPSSRLEIELDEGSAWRLGADSLGEISDYSRLSTGQRVTLLSLDHGVGYFTGQPLGKDSLMLAVPGAQVTFNHGARIRLEAQEQWSRIVVIEGAVRFSSPAAEMDLHEGQSTRVEPANPARFFLYREVPAMDLDRWSEDRDRALYAPASAAHVREQYGLVDLDRSGEWIQTEDLGAVWKPRAAEGWTPYQKGRWRWYDTLGYAWVSDDAWGWLPYHYGRWTRRDNAGWVWAPSKNSVFKPGEVYWLRGAKLAGWGPLAPGEEWTPSDPPQLFLNAYTTYAAFQQDARLIDPAGFTARPKEPLGAAVFVRALPSPAFVAARLEATRPVLRAGSTRVTPVLSGVTFQDVTTALPPGAGGAPGQPPEERVPIVTNPGTGEPPVIVSGPPPEPPPPVEVVYPVPVYTGIIVVNPPEHPDYSRRTRPQPSSPPGSSNSRVQPPSQPPSQATQTPPQPPAAPPQTSVPIPRVGAEPRHEHPPAVTVPVQNSEPKPDVKSEVKTDGKSDPKGASDSKPVARSSDDTTGSRATRKQ